MKKAESKIKWGYQITLFTNFQSLTSKILKIHVYFHVNVHYFLKIHLYFHVNVYLHVMEHEHEHKHEHENEHDDEHE
jgi:hypothetical protein